MARAEGLGGRAGAGYLADVFLAALAVAVGLVARLLHLEHKPLWLDEVLTLNRAHLAPHALVADSFANRHMPSYFLIVRWFAQLGDDAATLRLPSVLFGALSVGVLYAIGRRLGGRTAGIVAALLLALSPQQVQYGQEARSYTLETLLIVIALWGIVRIAQAPVQSGRGVLAGWGAYVLGTVGALDVLAGAAPWLIAANLAFLLIWRAQGAQRRAFARHWAGAHGMIGVLCLPLYALLIAGGDGHMAAKFNWIPRLSWHGVWVSFASTYLMRASAVVHLDLLPAAVPVLAPIVGGLAVIGAWRLRHRPDGGAVVLAAACLPAMVIAVSLFQPLLLPRYILWSAAPFFLLAGAGAAAMPRRVTPVAIAALFVAAATNLAPFYQTETKPRWDLAATRLADRVKPNDTILTADPNAPAMLQALQPRNRKKMDQTALVTQDVAVAVARWKQGGRVWAIHGRSGLGKQEDLADFVSRLTALGAPAEEIPVGEEITILLFPEAAGDHG
jgi:uncharacterized membrane protein